MLLLRTVTHALWSLRTGRHWRPTCSGRPRRWCSGAWTMRRGAPSRRGSLVMEPMSSGLRSISTGRLHASPTANDLRMPPLLRIASLTAASAANAAAADQPKNPRLVALTPVMSGDLLPNGADVIVSWKRTSGRRCLMIGGVSSDQDRLIKLNAPFAGGFDKSLPISNGDGIAALHF